MCFFVSRNFIRNGIVVMTFLILRRNIHVRRRENGCVSWGRVSVIPCLICFTTIFELQDTWNIIFFSLFSLFFRDCTKIRTASPASLSLYRHTGPSHLLQLLRTVESQNTVQKKCWWLVVLSWQDKNATNKKNKNKRTNNDFFCPPSLFGSLHLDWYFLLFTTSCNVFLPRTPFETSIAMSEKISIFIPQKNIAQQSCKCLKKWIVSSHTIPCLICALV